MAYSTAYRHTAEALAKTLKSMNPESRFEVSLHDIPRHRWGVLRYDPYCDEMPFKCIGFVWVDGWGE